MTNEQKEALVARAKALGLDIHVDSQIIDVDGPRLYGAYRANEQGWLMFEADLNGITPTAQLA